MSWEKKQLDECCEITSSKRIFYSEYTDFGIPFYRSKEIIESSQGQTISEPLYITEEKYNEIKTKFSVPKAGDMLLTSVGTIGIPYIVKDTDCFYFKDGNLTWFKNFNDFLESKFLFYWIKSAEGFGVLNNTTIGSSQKALTISALKQIEIPCPPIKIQRKIINILSSYDELIDNNKKQIKLLEEAAQRLYKEWFVDLRFPGYEDVKIVDGVPEGWTEGTLGDIAYNAGENEKKEHRDNYSFYLPIDCLPSKSLAYIDTNEATMAESSLVAFKTNDILFGAMRPYFHKVVIARGKGLTRSTCFVINAKECSVWSFLVMLLFSEDTINYATRISVGTTMPYVRWKDFVQMPVLIPTEIVCIEFGKQFIPISEKIGKLAEQNIRLRQARDRLLPKLMSGEIEV